MYYDSDSFILFSRKVNKVWNFLYKLNETRYTLKMMAIEGVRLEVEVK